MALTPKNWKNFQHYSDRKPAWIKLHRGLLDDFTYSRLPLASRALAPLLWLLASEYQDGKITAGLDEIAFRAHVTIDELIDALNPLVSAGFFIDDSDALADGKQTATLEREKEKQVQTEKEGEKISSLRSDSTRETSIIDDWPKDYRDQFWNKYPRKVARKSAFKVLDRIRKSHEVTFAKLMAGIEKIPIGEPVFIPHPATWLNAGRWDDEPSKPGVSNAKSPANQTGAGWQQRRDKFHDALAELKQSIAADEREASASEASGGPVVRIDPPAGRGGPEGFDGGGCGDFLELSARSHDRGS